MDRKELVKALKTVKPALAQKDYIPILNHYCFTGDRLFAYDDVLFISMPFETKGWGGGIPDVLLNNMERFEGNNLTIVKRKDGKLSIKGIDTTKRKESAVFNVIPVEDFIIDQIPIVGGFLKFDLTQDFVDGLKLCLQSVSTQETQPKMQGITIDINEAEKSVTLYATDRRTISSYSLSGDDLINYITPVTDAKRSYVLPTKFCELAINLFEEYHEERPLDLFLSNNAAEVAFIDGHHAITKLINNEDPLDFEKQIDGILSDLPSWDDLQPIPKNLSKCIETIAVFDDAKAALSIDNNFLGVNAEGTKGLGDQGMQLDANHPDRKTTYDAKALLNGLNSCEEFYFTEKCGVMMSAGNYIYLIADYE